MNLGKTIILRKPKNVFIKIFKCKNCPYLGMMCSAPKSLCYVATVQYPTYRFFLNKS